MAPAVREERHVPAPYSDDMGLKPVQLRRQKTDGTNQRRVGAASRVLSSLATPPLTIAMEAPSRVSQRDGDDRGAKQVGRRWRSDTSAGRAEGNLRKTLGAKKKQLRGGERDVLQISCSGPFDKLRAYGCLASSARWLVSV